MSKANMPCQNESAELNLDALCDLLDEDDDKSEHTEEGSSLVYAADKSNDISTCKPGDMEITTSSNQVSVDALQAQILEMQKQMMLMQKQLVEKSLEENTLGLSKNSETVNHSINNSQGTPLSNTEKAPIILKSF